MTQEARRQSEARDLVKYVRATRENILALDKKMGGNAFKDAYYPHYKSLEDFLKSFQGDHIYMRYLDDGRTFHKFAAEQSFKNDVMVRTNSGLPTRHTSVDGQDLGLSKVKCHYDRASKTQKLSFSNMIRAKVAEFGTDVEGAFGRKNPLLETAGIAALLLVGAATFGFNVYNNVANSVKIQAEVTKVVIERNWTISNHNKHNRWEAEVTAKKNNGEVIVLKENDRFQTGLEANYLKEGHSYELKVVEGLISGNWKLLDAEERSQDSPSLGKT
jgi:hypothetical protein